VMKVLEQLVERVLEKSNFMSRFIASVETLTSDVHNIAIVTVSLVEAVKLHHKMLLELHKTQQNPSSDNNSIEFGGFKNDEGKLPKPN
jgi:hypothetical protein